MPLPASRRREPVCRQRLPGSESDGECVGRGASRNIKPQGNGGRKGGFPPARDRILAQHSVGGGGWAVRSSGWDGAERGESGRGCGKQLGWPSSLRGDGARLASSPRGSSPARGRQALPSSPPAPPAGWSTALERQAEPSRQPGTCRRGPRAGMPGTRQHGLAKWPPGGLR